MTRHVLVIAAFALLVAPAARGQDSFTPGHIFVSVLEPEPCDQGLNGREAIIEIDPTTGEMSIFADSDDGICIVTGLRFTPDGSRLLLLNGGHLFPFDKGWIQAFKPDGTSEVILDGSDGLARPVGSNGLAFDSRGDLYVVQNQVSAILRFPADGGPGTVFADASDGIRVRGALDFAPNGDLFYASDPANTIIRVNPDGVGSVFDPEAPTNTHTMAIDRAGNIFIGVGGGAILRYDHGDPNRLRFLATGFNQGAMALAVSPDQSAVYFAENLGKVYSVDAEDGTTTLLVDMSELPFTDTLHPHGMAVFDPPPPEPIPTVNHWGVISLALAILVLFRLAYRRSFRPGAIVVCRCLPATPEARPDSSRFLRSKS